MTTFYDLPLPSSNALKKSAALSECIQQEIARQNGLISFATFMELALYHPKWGYYNADDFKLGPEGDFTTAVEISPLYAQCFAKQCIPLLTHFDKGAFLELGAGTGRFTKDLLVEFAKHQQLPEHYFIYEISENLRKKQQVFLKYACPEFIDRIHWLDTLPTQFTGIVIANEVLDALPTHCFRIEKGTIYERCVAYHHPAFSWQLKKPSQPVLAEKIHALYALYSFADTYESEINLHIPQLLQALSKALLRGIIFFADYGYGQRELYHPQRQHGSLNCFYQHRQHSCPLILPGLQDITTHVDFTAVAESAIEYGFELQGFTSQAAFLFANGLLELATEAEQGLNDTDAFHLHQAIKTLTLPTEMGERIKIMALSKNMEIALPSFSFQDKRREL